MLFGANCRPRPTGDGPPFLAMHKGHIFGSIKLANVLGIKFDLGPQLAPKIAREVIIHLTAADMHIAYDSALMVVQSSKARQYGSGFQDEATY